MKIEDIKIDEEFKNLLPGLSDDELKRLRENIIADGEIREPFIVWDGLLVDGHNRRDVWFNLTDDERKKVSKPAFILKKFDDRESVKDWMIKKQLGQRNLSAKDRAYLVGLKYEAKKKNVAENLKNPLKTPKVQNEPLGDTATEIAEEVGESRSQVKRDVKFKKAIDAIEEQLGTPAKKELMDKKSKVSKSKIIEIGELEPEKMQAAFDRAMGRGTPSGGNMFEPDEWGGRKPGTDSVLDGLKKQLPDYLHGVFADLPEYDGKIRELQKIMREIKTLSEKESAAFLRVQDIEEAIKNAVNVLKFAKPFTECPTCRRTIKKTCKNCKGSGFIAKRHYGEASGSGTLTKAEREWLEAR